jgi:hypothetical protein
MSRKGAWPIAVAAGAAGLLALGAVAATAATARTASSSTGPAAAPKWRITESVKTNANFTAVVATGKTTGWAFIGNGFDAAPVAYQLSGGTWKKAPFPGTKGDEQVITALATSPSDVWAFTQGTGTSFPGGSPARVLHYNGHTWSVVKTFGDQIAGASVVAANDVWVFGMMPFTGQPALGVWHYNGSRWTQVSKSIQGGSALSATNVWGFKGVDVEHWNGAKWTATSVKSLLPATGKNIINDPQVTRILALSPTNVWAIGNGVQEDEGGPTVVLHYNGSKWSKLAHGNYGFDAGPEFSSDGSGGLWLPMYGPVAGSSYLLHYSAGKLTVAALPVGPTKMTVYAVSQIPGTTQQLAAGETHASRNFGSDIVAVLLKYS